MVLDNFCFLRECLDEDSVKYLKSGLMSSCSDMCITPDDLIFRIGQILGVSSIDEAPYTSTVLAAFNPYVKFISQNIRKDNKSWEARIIKFFRSINDRLNYDRQKKNNLNDNIEIHNTVNEICDEVQSIDSIFELIYEWIIETTNLPPDWSIIAKEWYPYFFLSFMKKEYPDWLLFQDFPIELYGLPTETREKHIAALPCIWQNKLKTTFDNDKTREEFKRLLFLISFIEVLRREYILLEESSLLPLPIQLPSNISSRFIRIKLESIPKERENIHITCIALIMGVYNKCNHTSDAVKYLIALQEAGTGEMTSVRPINVSSWQAKKIIDQHSLDPLFALISSLKYSEPSFWAQVYYDFREYADEDKVKLGKRYSGTLYLNHFFPYHNLHINDVIKPEGLSNPELSTDGVPTGNLIYHPLVKDGICIDLADRIYLLMYGFDDSILRLAQESDIGIFSYIQSENIDAAVSKHYYKYLSDIGAWRVVKDKFEAELDKRVMAAIADIRHNVKHYVDHLPRQTQKIEEFLIAPDSGKRQRIIDYAHDTHKQIKIALRVLNYSLSGLESSQSNNMKWNETISLLLYEMPNLTTKISVEYDKGNVSDEITFPFREKAFYFAQMIQNIIKNAEDHGFKDSDITTPKIKIVSEFDEDSIYLSFMNNGTPLSESMTIDKYRTRGLTGNSGNSGLGGAQIDRIIRAHGGEICELSSSKEWNFILKIKFRLK